MPSPVLRLAALLLLLSPIPAAAAAVPAAGLPLTGQVIGLAVLGIFIVAYALVVLEDKLGMRKSVPVMVAAALIWGLLALHAGHDPSLPAGYAASAFRHVFAEFCELFFFLIVAMSFVGAMTERNVFEFLRAQLVRRRLGYRALFWLTGVISFFLSALIDNLTTALVMSAVIFAVGAGNRRFVTLACINLVVAANAGGAWSAFGDITTLMVWQAHRLEFFAFLRLFLPSLVNWLLPAMLMSLALPAGRPESRLDDVRVKSGGWSICVTFAGTIALTIAAAQWLRMPPVFGMLAGLAALQAQAWWIRRRELATDHRAEDAYDLFHIIARAEWDTLLFFNGALLAVGGLATAGFMQLAANHLYGGLGATAANVAMGLLSALVDNIPIMYAVLQMAPAMDSGQWLLVTLACGVGGSLLSVGSAAGVALMGVSGGRYTFMGHLKWSWAIALGYIASILVHLWLDSHLASVAG